MNVDATAMLVIPFGNAGGSKISVENTNQPTRHVEQRHIGRQLGAKWCVLAAGYRKRFGIETSYRQMNEAKIKTCTRDPRLRLLFVGIALVLRNVWVWIHFRFAKGKYSNEPQLFLELLRFQEMLLWITQIVQQTLGADKTLGLDRHTYERLTKHCHT